MLLFYIRHGDPIYDPDQLTPLGRRQAEAVAKRLALFGIDEIYSSTSTRAMQTATPTSEIVKKDIIPLDWMHEDLAYNELKVKIDENSYSWVWSHPVYSQILSSREVRSAGDKWYEHPSLRDFHFEKSLQRIGSNADAWLATLGYEHDRDKGLYKITADKTDKRIALFAHEGVGKVFLSEILDIPYPYYAAHFDMKHSGVTVISFDEGRRYGFDGYARARVLTLSNDSHIYREGLPMTHISSWLSERY